MSLAALIVVAVAVMSGASPRDIDEGAAAHLWQLLMAGQLPVMAWFVVSRVRKGLGRSGLVLAFQAGALLLAAAPVALLGL